MKSRCLYLSLSMMFFLCSWTPSYSAMIRDFEPAQGVVSHNYTGVALYGFDPVSYFLPTGAQMGSSDFEAHWDNKVWRFTSKANRAAFLSQPELYAPKHGGFDPIFAKKGLQVEGRPMLYLITTHGLYLFRNEETFHAYKQGLAQLG